MYNYLDIKNIRFSNKTAFILIAVAYIFSLALRYYWFYWASDISGFLFHSQVMINNPDGYYYASGARDLLSGHHQLYNINPVYSGLSVITAAIVKLFPFLSLDDVILWLPAVFGSLLVVPVFLIGRSLGNDILGFVSSLLSGIAWSYYNRTMTGYYDTDMLVIVLMAFVVWAVLEFHRTKNLKLSLFLLFIMVFYEWWYPQCRVTLLSVFGMYILYVLIKQRKDIKNWIFIGIFGISLFAFPFYANLILGILAYYIFTNSKYETKKNVYIFLGLVLIGILFSGTLNVLYGEIYNYFNRNNRLNNNLHYFSVMKTVRESSGIPYWLVADRISGSVAGFIFSLIGLIILTVRYPIMIISFPLVVLGLLAHKIGLRFTIYAVPFMALGFGYLTYLAVKWIKTAIWKYLIMAGITGLVLYPNIKHIYEYKTPVTFTNTEVKVLEKLKHMANPNSYIVTWWDYGYPIRYYANLNTLVDGGIHSGSVNYPVSFVLTRPELPSYNMAVLDTYFVDKIRKEKLKKITPVELMMKYYHTNDPEQFINMLHSKISLPKFNKDIYYYLPLRMINIFPTVSIFSNINLTTGRLKEHFLYFTNNFILNSNKIVLSNGWNIDLAQKAVVINNQLIPIHKLAITEYTKKGLIKKIIPVNSRGIDVVLMKSYHKILFMDDFYFNSAYIQMFVFENYDKHLFKPVILNPLVKIYKVIK